MPPEDRIPFNRPGVIGTEAVNVSSVLERQKFSGVGPWSRQSSGQLEALLGSPCVLTTSSGSHALEMAALLCDIGPGDEVILPSFAFPTTASAFARCGARLVFVDVQPNTMNIDPDAAAHAVTPRTRAIVALHYGGVPCDMTALGSLAELHGLRIVEDAAQALGSNFDGRPAGMLGNLACFSFHETKNVHCGEGGALAVNDPSLIAHAEMVLEKGTDRSRFIRREVDRYTWQTIGSSYVMGELQAAFLSAQLEGVKTLTDDRMRTWLSYHAALSHLQERGWIEAARIPDNIAHNGHTVWIKTHDAAARDHLIDHLDRHGIHAVFHYVPLHSSPAGRRFGRFVGEDLFTTRDSERLLRLPIFFGFDEVDRVVAAVEDGLTTHLSRR